MDDGDNITDEVEAPRDFPSLRALIASRRPDLDPSLVIPVGLDALRQRIADGVMRCIFAAIRRQAAAS